MSHASHPINQKKRTFQFHCVCALVFFFWGGFALVVAIPLNRKIPAVSTQFQGHVDLCTSLDLHSIHPIDEPFEGSG